MKWALAIFIGVVAFALFGTLCGFSYALIDIYVNTGNGIDVGFLIAGSLFGAPLGAVAGPVVYAIIRSSG